MSCCSDARWEPMKTVGFAAVDGARLVRGVEHARAEIGGAKGKASRRASRWDGLEKDPSASRGLGRFSHVVCAPAAPAHLVCGDPGDARRSTLDVRNGIRRHDKPPDACSCWLCAARRHIASAALPQAFNKTTVVAGIGPAADFLALRHLILLGHFRPGPRSSATATASDPHRIAQQVKSSAHRAQEDADALLHPPTILSRLANVQCSSQGATCLSPPPPAHHNTGSKGRPEAGHSS